jgi:hypothetical protein
MSPRWLHWPAATAGGGSDWGDYMTANAGASYVIFPSSTSTTNDLSWTGSSGLGTITGILVDGDNTYPYTVDSNTVTTSFGFRGYLSSIYSGSGYSQPSDEYLAAYFAQGSTYEQAQANGWIIFKLTDNFSPGANNMYWEPIEAKSGVTASSTQYASGMPQKWTAATPQDLIIFAMNSYTLGDVQSWTDWDGTTNP